jgi:hypothetical protein
LLDAIRVDHHETPDPEAREVFDEQHPHAARTDHPDLEAREKGLSGITKESGLTVKSGIADRLRERRRAERVDARPDDNHLVDVGSATLRPYVARYGAPREDKSTARRSTKDVPNGRVSALVGTEVVAREPNGA